MAEKQGTSITIEETENAKIYKTIVETINKMNEKMNKMTKEARENAREIFDQMKDLKSDVRKLAFAIGEFNEKEKDFKLKIIELYDEIKDKDYKNLELRQELERKTQEIVRMEAKLSDLDDILDFQTTADEQLPIASVEQLRASSNFYMGAILEKFNKIEEIRCKAKGTKQTTKQQVTRSGQKE